MKTAKEQMGWRTNGVGRDHGDEWLYLRIWQFSALTQNTLQRALWSPFPEMILCVLSPHLVSALHWSCVIYYTKFPHIQKYDEHSQSLHGNVTAARRRNCREATREETQGQINNGVSCVWILGQKKNSLKTLETKERFSLLFWIHVIALLCLSPSGCYYTTFIGAVLIQDVFSVITGCALRKHRGRQMHVWFLLNCE